MQNQTDQAQAVLVIIRDLILTTTDPKEVLLLVKKAAVEIAILPPTEAAIEAHTLIDVLEVW